MERTFVMLKPDALRRHLMGRIIEKLEMIDPKFLKIVKAQMLPVVPLEMIESHYAEHVGKPFYADLIEHMTSGPVLLMVMEGRDVIAKVREKVGAAKNPEWGTIRQQYGAHGPKNLVHSSDSPESAAREEGLWFPEAEDEADREVLAFRERLAGLGRAAHEAAITGGTLERDAWCGVISNPAYTSAHPNFHTNLNM